MNPEHPSQSTGETQHDPLTCELCHAEGVGAELAALREERDSIDSLYSALREDNERLREAIDLMLAEIEGIDIGFENGCKGAALMVGKEALGYD